MKERPLILKDFEVRAIRDGRQTMFRRVCKPVRHPDLGNLYDPGAFVLEGEPQHVIERASPYGQPGDRLWVREAHAQVFEVDIPTGRPVGPIGTSGSPGRPDWKCRYVYRADGEMPNVQWHHVGDSQPVRWTRSIHMPRWASRITLEITDVRVERLNDISEADALAEGVKIDECGHAIRDDDHVAWGSARTYFAELWDKINGTGSWDANPWVWVTTFKRVQP